LLGERRITRNQGKSSRLTPPALASTSLTKLPWISSRSEPGSHRKAGSMMNIVRNLWHEDQGQDIAEYAVMLAVILVIVVGTIRLVGNNANNVFSSVGSSVQ
jgi:Flp pilus assembly pilin Flp